MPPGTWHGWGEDMKMTDYRRLKVEGAPKTTHLDRYQLAADRNVRTVFDVRCPHCGAPPTAWCLEG